MIILGRLKFVAATTNMEKIIAIRIDEELLKRILDKARESERNLSQYLRYLIKKDLIQ